MVCQNQYLKNQCLLMSFDPVHGSHGTRVELLRSEAGCFPILVDNCNRKGLQKMINELNKMISKILPIR